MKILTLVDIQKLIPNIRVDLLYATPNNFTKETIYDFTCCLLVEEAALKLKRAQEEIESIGLGFKVWDGYRPLSAQEKFWSILPDERYISNPKKGGRHTRGTAVDLTLVTLKEGQELPMPTPFDEFTERAHRSWQGGTKEELANREFLQEVMERHGFIGLPTEWWHFDLIGWEKMAPLADHFSNK